MKQVLQDLRTGRIEVAEVPSPSLRPGSLLVHTAATLISPGTERMLVEFGRAGLVAKARSQPERVRQVVDKIRTDGLRPALEAVTSRLDEPLALGYCSAGRVVRVGDGVEGFAPGDRVVSNGPHAEIACVPAGLATRIPDSVDDECASFGVLGAIALNGVRLLEPTLGEGFAVVGLGLLGLLAVQLLRAHGCRVLAVDLDPSRCERAAALGADSVCASGSADSVRAAHEASRGHGLDGVLIAAASQSDEIVHAAARMCRRRGRIVLVGVVGLRLRRNDFYEKELSFRVACSYGPGRYDPAYEIHGHDYPLPYVRWTAARNFEAILDAMAEGRVDVRALISRRVALADAARAYEAIVADRSALGVVLTYPSGPPPLAQVAKIAHCAEPRPGARAPVVGVIGSGAFARQVLLPAIAAAGVRIAAVASAGGVSSLQAARRFGADLATTDVEQILGSPSINTVFIATRHDSHARLAAAALEAGKHVFVEKPLAIDAPGLERVRRAWESAGGLALLVGFNRRFAPHAVAAKRLLAGRSQPIALSITVNAGELPPDHWTRDPAIGGGRIVGEACHFIDLAAFLVGHPIARVQSLPLVSQASGVPESVSIGLAFGDGSIATVHYLGNGPRSYPKERIELFSEGRVLTIDNWRAMRAHDWPAARRMWIRQDKGHRAEVARFLTAVAGGGEPLVSFDEIDNVTRATLAAARSAVDGAAVDLAAPPAAEALSTSSSSLADPRDGLPAWHAGG